MFTDCHPLHQQTKLSPVTVCLTKMSIYVYVLLLLLFKSMVEFCTFSQWCSSPNHFKVYSLFCSNIQAHIGSIHVCSNIQHTLVQYMYVKCQTPCEFSQNLVQTPSHDKNETHYQGLQLQPATVV
jgi:hypothetical protein